MRLTIICDRVSWEEKDLMKSAMLNGIKLSILNVKDSKKMFDLMISGRRKLKSSLCLQRCISYYKGLYSTVILERKGFKVINSFDASRICGDKLLTSLVLSENGIPIPKTFIAFSKEQALKTLRRVGYPVILKPLIGSWGRLISLLQDEETAYTVITFRETSSNPLYKIFYLQEYIPKNRDIRAFIVGEEVVAAMYRYNLKNDWRSSATAGARTEPCPITDELENICINVAKAVKGEILGVDLINKKGELLVTEVNHVPQFKAITETTGIKISEKIIRYLKNSYSK